MNNVKDFNASKIFLIITLLFGLASILLAFPLSNGDEGYHLSKSYQFFRRTILWKCQKNF